MNLITYQEEKEMTDYIPDRACPICGGRLCVNSTDPERVYCDTCDYEEPPCAPADEAEGDGL